MATEKAPCKTCKDSESCKFQMWEPCDKALQYETQMKKEDYLSQRYQPKGIGRGFGDWHNKNSRDPK